MSALGYSHKLVNFPDPSKIFYVSQMLKGYCKVGFRLDSRLPITLPILDKLISVAPRLRGSYYQISQFRAMCSLAFYAFLRVGEITSVSKRDSTPPLQLYQITKLLNQAGNLVGFKVTFTTHGRSLLRFVVNLILVLLICYRNTWLCKGTVPDRFS